MKVRIVLNGGAEVVYDDVWEVHCAERGAEFKVQPYGYIPVLEVTTSRPTTIEPQTRFSVHIGVKHG